MVSEGAPPPISPDGRFWWDGVQWQPLYTPDGRFRWNGREWLPVAEAPVAAPVAVAAPVLGAAPAAPSAAVVDRPDWLADGQPLPADQLAAASAAEAAPPA